MVAKRVDAAAGNSKPRPRPATTPEARELQMVALAFDVAEQQMLNGTASAQVITHFLKYGSEQNKLEREKLRRENILMEARVTQISNTAQNSELYEEVLKAMKVYTGEESEDI